MKQQDYMVRVLVPDEGHKLTQSADVALLERIVSDKVFLAVNASPSDWVEITDEQADEIVRQQVQAQEQAEAEEGRKPPPGLCPAHSEACGLLATAAWKAAAR